MSEFKGTQGKWVISGTTRDFYGNTGYFLSSKVKISEVEANALLISKAPELLAMLGKLVSGNTIHPRHHNLKLDAIKLIKDATEL